MVGSSRTLARRQRGRPRGAKSGESGAAVPSSGVSLTWGKSPSSCGSVSAMKRGCWIRVGFFT